MLLGRGAGELFKNHAAWQLEAGNGGLSDAQLASSVAHGGDGMRVRRFMGLLTAGQPVSMAVVGGSISAGATYTTLRGDKASWLWHRLFFDWLNASFPHRANSQFNGALPASTPGYVESCITLHVPVASDLVFVEYAANFDNPRAYERLLRRLLRYRPQPAIILLNMPYFFGNDLARNIDQSLPTTARDLNFTFQDTMAAENSITLLAQHYGVPSLSMRNALFHEMQANVTEAMRLKDVMLDRVHPSVRGHQYAAALAVGFLRREMLLMAATASARGASLPTNQTLHGGERSRRQMPPPMYAGNEDDSAYVCVRGKELLPLVKSYGGWEYRVEGDRFSNPKPGLVATTPGKRLELCWQPPQLWHKATIKFGYLTSYEQMGRANYSCSGSCSCRAGIIDAYTHRRRSVHWVTSLSVVSMQGARRRRGGGHSTPLRQVGEATGCCMLSITTMADPKGARNKFKVLSLYVASRSASFAWLHGKTIWNIEHGLEEGTFTDPEIPSSMRVEGKSTLMTSRKDGRHRGSRGGGPKGGVDTATGVGARGGKGGGRRAKGRGRGRPAANASGVLSVVVN